MRPTLTRLSKSASSKQWLSRQARDPYVKARASSPSHYRARSAFKLLEMDKKYNIIKRDKTRVVVDLGAAPGGWSQVVADVLGVSKAEDPSVPVRFGSDDEKALEDIIAERESASWSSALASSASDGGALKAKSESGGGGGGGGGKAIIIALDLLPIAPIRGVRTVRQDFLTGGDAAIRSLLPTPETKADVILSDMAPNISGNKIHDEAASLEICQAVYQFAARYLRVGGSAASDGGTLVLKHFANESSKAFYLDMLKPNFYHTYIVKPNASRDESSEYYFVSKGFKGDPYYDSETPADLGVE